MLQTFPLSAQHNRLYGWIESLSVVEWHKHYEVCGEYYITRLGRSMDFFCFFFSVNRSFSFTDVRHLKLPYYDCDTSRNKKPPVFLCRIHFAEILMCVTKMSRLLATFFYIAYVVLDCEIHGLVFRKFIFISIPNFCVWNLTMFHTLLCINTFTLVGHSPSCWSLYAFVRMTQEHVDGNVFNCGNKNMEI